MTDAPSTKKPGTQNSAPTGTPVGTAPATPAQPKGPVTPESEASARIAHLQTAVDALKAEVKTLKGKLANRDPVLQHKLKSENEALTTRLKLLKKALFGIMMDSYKPRLTDEAEIKYEVLRRAAVDYFKKANIAPEIWKNIES